MTDEPTTDLHRGLGNPARNAFAVVSIHTLADVTTWTERDLLALHGVGPKAIRALRQQLADRDLAFCDPEG